MRRKSIGSAGFTLVEVLAAGAMLALVIGAIYGAFRAGNQSTILMEESADLHQTARIVLDRMNRELCSICGPSDESSSPLTGENEALGNATHFDKLSFATVSHEPCSGTEIRGGVCAVTYSAESTPDGSPLGLFVREDFTPGLHGAEGSDDDLPVTRISKMVVGMDCAFLDRETGEWIDEWVDESDLPEAVRIELILRPERKGAKPIVVAMTANLPESIPSPGTEGETRAGQ